LSWPNLNFTKITSDCQLKLQNYWYLSFYNNSVLASLVIGCF